MSRLKPKDASEHHAALLKMRMRYDGDWTLNNGARFHRFAYRQESPRTAIGKLHALFTEQGYRPGETRDVTLTTGQVWSRKYSYLRGNEVVRIHAYTTSASNLSEYVQHLDHFEEGMAGDPSRARISIDQLVNAMSWGCA